MEYRPLHITLKSAEGLKNASLFGKMDVYAEISIAGYPQSVKRTSVDKNGGTSPKWKKDHPMEFIVDEPYLTKPGLSLLFQLKDECSFGPDKVIGSATVPIHDLFKPDSDLTRDNTVEYQIYTPSGKPKGSLKFSYKFGEKFTHQAPAAAPETKEKQHAPDPVTAYPAAGGSAYPPPAAPYPGQAYPPPGAAGYGAYPPQGGAYGYGAPPPPGYGYAPPPQGYGYPPQGAYGQPPKKNKAGMGAGLGLGLGAGLLGGLLVGEMASEAGEAAAYADGYGDAMDGGGFDF
ncbi:calcium-dependent lipid-binding family protein [Striga asiatica]|uniref:Calcium-dependent lipid-binding family protein n=1 Tax=Striga asiatica TaxID=4170 RepID=A0A5A7PJV1_STRAF|nr:calcium-dependent lipid-binding family protein [Striga asiatica]